MIESVQNKKVKEWVKLQDKKYRDETGLFLIESIHLVEEALKTDLIKEIILLEGNTFKSNYPTTTVSLPVMKKISSQVTPPTICAVCKKIKEKEIKGNVLILDGISDPGNLGTIIRSSVAFGMPNIILSLDCVDLYNPKVIRSCEGMVFHVNICRRNLIDFMSEYTSYDYYTTDVVKGLVLKDINFKKEKTAVIIGNEGKGVKEEIKNLCQKSINIPMNKSCESLNAAVSASIILYELSK